MFILRLLYGIVARILWFLVGAVCLIALVCGIVDDTGMELVISKKGVQFKKAAFYNM